MLHETLWNKRSEAKITRFDNSFKIKRLIYNYVRMLQLFL